MEKLEEQLSDNFTSSQTFTIHVIDPAKLNKYVHQDLEHTVLKSSGREAVGSRDVYNNFLKIQKPLKQQITWLEKYDKDGDGKEGEGSEGKVKASSQQKANRRALKDFWQDTLERFVDKFAGQLLIAKAKQNADNKTVNETPREEETPKSPEVKKTPGAATTPSPRPRKRSKASN
jgi:hypothetical protein